MIKKPFFQNQTIIQTQQNVSTQWLHKWLKIM